MKVIGQTGNGILVEVSASELRAAIHRVESAQVDLKRIQEALDTFKTLEIIQPEPEKKKEAKET